MIIMDTGFWVMTLITLALTLTVDSVAKEMIWNCCRRDGLQVWCITISANVINLSICFMMIINVLIE